ncbi:hypothetical protein [Mycobacteroides abscessus]|uniref:hypothetical protein n=1 Tax=Mycobacteroides abscessus TaxID=36809 RepID=UPI0009CC42CE|nr:hypothetical protein [Mycobacteroides abscessus]SLC72440.1 Uncharacterised protein [Mycobacteroides abscessus subsp. massiliense]SLJ50193.1 Uncharacterised protein [Mycobacteroides abscessus subsp. abscessus]
MTEQEVSEADVARVLAHIGGRSVSHPESGATGWWDMPAAQFRACVDTLRERGYDIIEFTVCGGDRQGNETGYALRPIEYTAAPEVVDRDGVTRAGISAAGVPQPMVDLFVGLTDQIVQCESAWQPNAIAVDFERYTHGVAPDGVDYAAPRGLTGMQPRQFQKHRPTGSSANIYDPVASIAALWRFVAAEFGVDLTTGTGLPEFRRLWRTHRRNWWNMPWPPLKLMPQTATDFEPAG